jgi:HK97 family phage portal protein
MGLRAWLRGDDISLGIDAEDRALTQDNIPPVWLPYGRYSQRALLDVGRHSALAVADAYACVRVLSDSVASLPPNIYRKTPAGRVPVGQDQRLAALLQTPTPGSTSSDLFALAMVYLNIYGNCYIGKFRSPDGEVAQLACIHPDRVVPVPKGSTLAYRIDGDDSYTVRDVIHIKSMPDPLTGGLTGLSPVSQCRVAISLSSSLMESAKQYHENGGMPSGVLNVEGASEVGLSTIREEWKNRQGLQAGRMHSIAFLSGDARFTPIAFSADDAQFLQQRELSAREVARVFRVPGWMIDADTGGSMTYSNVSQQALAFTTYSLTPWLERLERAFSNDPELLPGGSYLEFSLDGLLRADPAGRADNYVKALGDNTRPGWMTRAEVRELENLPPEGGPTQ